MKNQLNAALKIGDVVDMKHHWYTGRATVVAFREGLTGFDTEGRNQFNHDCDGAAKGDGHGLWLYQPHVYCKLVAPIKLTRKFTPKSQNGMLLSHLLEGRTITRIQADHLYRIASLTRRIKDLREAGHKIMAAVKVDPTGRPYTEYNLRKAGRV